MNYTAARARPAMMVHIEPALNRCRQFHALFFMTVGFVIMQLYIIMNKLFQDATLTKWTVLVANESLVKARIAFNFMKNNLFSKLTHKCKGLSIFFISLISTIISIYHARRGSLKIFSPTTSRSIFTICVFFSHVLLYFCEITVIKKTLSYWMHQFYIACR